VNFDLLISDANMPMYSGFDLIQTIRNNSKFSEMSIAMLTGLRERTDIERAVKVGVDDYIVKPIDPMLFLQKVAALFARKTPTQHPEILLASSKEAQGILHRPIVVESISELGIRILTSEPQPAGQRVDVDATIFQTLGIETVPPLKVLRSEKDEATGMYRTQLIFLGARETVLQKIRRWIYSHGASNKVG
jgi:DNA-binding response OmpR family regulator